MARIAIRNRITEGEKGKYKSIFHGVYYKLVASSQLLEFSFDRKIICDRSPCSVGLEIMNKSSEFESNIKAIHRNEANISKMSGSLTVLYNLQL